jgi:hypothetical protein
MTYLDAPVTLVSSVETQETELPSRRDRVAALRAEATELQLQLGQGREYAAALWYERNDTSLQRASKKLKKQRTRAYLERAARQQLHCFEDLEVRQRQRFATALWGIANRTVQQQKKQRTKCTKIRSAPPLREEC